MQRDHSAAIQTAFAAYETGRVGKVVLPPLRFEFGPYLSPLVEVGDEVMCARHGGVVVVGWSAGPLCWPLCHVNGPRSLVLFDELERAVKVESARSVALAWGVSRFTVSRWRQALEVARCNAGTAARWSRNVPIFISPAQNRERLERAHAPQARIKAELTKRKNGKMRQQWTPQQIAQMGVLSDAVIGEGAGCDGRTVERERKRRGIVCQGAGGKQQGTHRLDGTRVQTRRRQLGLTQSDVAALFGCGHCRISHLENPCGARVIEETLNRLARALSCAPETLLVKDS